MTQRSNHPQIEVLRLPGPARGLPDAPPTTLLIASLITVLVLIITGPIAAGYGFA